MYILKDIMTYLEQLAPLKLAEKWDNVGLMLGSRRQSVQKVLCALDVNEEVVEEAIKSRVQCIITHHPFFFSEIKCVDLDTKKGMLIAQLLSHSISVYSMHTNFDSAPSGLNDFLCTQLGLKNCQVLQITGRDSLYKGIVYVPETHYEKVREAIITHNPYKLGMYTGCTFTSQGEGTFKPLEGSHPYIGKQQQLEKVAEKKIEWLCRASDLQALLAVVREVHPYEEVAFDVYKMQHLEEVYGLGRYGELERPVTFEAFLEKVKYVFNIKQLRSTQLTFEKPIQRVAICSGSGASFLTRAAQVADLYITGDMKFHEAQEAKSLGLCVLDVGHYASENGAMAYLGQKLSETFENLEVVISKVHAETLHIL
ncbi:Nif3-like dinuclear metal center hexameric protein [Sporanaerobium hydrogeniformans]|uniref:Nif3-like dinuclear metal center hexameric protein n=1 Tax=Sporanaerobium hydrogeniformans TaxID=3072179 RepID=A0AC61DEB9_9FIRM|nr:Nif3-like dinuclear metal center hexameric protein [Sporanaerobium hydrogeniformans]PHV71066.1 Nif3-like dinuclear metal center hexameric protein [Sporanaerobium hydrogeniformans]